MPAGEQVDPALEIEAVAVRLLAQREHSLHQLQGKLARRFGRAEFVRQVVDDLERRGLVSDERFTEDYVALRIRKGYGPLRIRAELQERGIDGSLAESYLDLGGETWMEHLVEVSAQRFGAERPGDRTAQAKQARFLQYRGFPESLVRRYLFD